jgi:streptogramin lyase
VHLRPPRSRARSLGTVAVIAAVVMVLVPVAAGAGTTGGSGPGPSRTVLSPAVSSPIISNLGLGIMDVRGMAAGPDGNVWFTNTGSFAIGRATPDGAVTTYATGDVRPVRIAAGSDGALWFTTQSAKLGRITTDGALTFRTAPSDLFDVIAGPDGALWLSQPGLKQVLRMTTAGDVTTFPFPDTDRPEWLAFGPDGNLWSANEFWSGNSISRMTTTGTVTTFTLPGAGSPGAIASGPDGSLWFTNATQRAIGKLTTAGVATMYTAPFVGYPTQITAGSDGKMWFSNDSGFRFMGSITPSGQINVTYLGGDHSNDMAAITTGADGNVWFVTGKNGLGKITPSGTATMFPGNGMSSPRSIVLGPDAAAWVANPDSIARVGADRVVTSFDGAAVANATSLTSGADGNLWFVSEFPAGIRRLTTSGDVTVFEKAGTVPTAVTPGPDGNIWFTYANGTWRGLGKITPDGEFTLFPTPDLPPPAGLVAGADGNLWFRSIESNDIYRMTPAGVVTTFNHPSLGQHLTMAAGADGNVWFGNGDNAIGRITMAGVVTTFPAPGLGASTGMAAGRDDNLWVISAPSSTLARVTPDGAVTLLPDSTISYPSGIAVGPDHAMWFTNSGNNSIGRAATAPAAPTQVAATAGKERVTVGWTPAPPSSDPATFTVTASPGGATCTWTSGPPRCTVTGLTAGVSYTFTVAATSAVGTSAPSAASNAVVPWSGSAYHPLTPARILDSRTAIGSWSAPLAAGAPKELQVTGLGGASEVPATASAVVMNVTATGGSANSFVTAWPVGSAQPTASNLNFAVGETIPNLVTVKLGTGGRVAFANAVGAVHLVADVVGYYDDGVGAGDLYTGVTPMRLLDSRTGNGGWGAALAAGAPRDLVVRQPGRAGGVPASATAVVANVTVTESSTNSFLSVWPSGAAQPGVSNLNFATGQTIANLAVVKIGDGGSIRIATADGSTHVIVDVVGYFDPTAGSRFHAVDPTRVLDDRIGKGLTGPWAAGQARALPLAGIAGTNVPAGATDVVTNVTATGATTGTFITVYPHGVDRPDSSNLNVGAGQTIPNLVTVRVGTSESIALFNAAGSVDLVADVVGYYAAT